MPWPEVQDKWHTDRHPFFCTMSSMKARSTSLIRSHLFNTTINSPTFEIKLASSCRSPSFVTVCTLTGETVFCCSLETSPMSFRWLIIMSSMESVWRRWTNSVASITRTFMSACLALKTDWSKTNKQSYEKYKKYKILHFCGEKIYVIYSTQNLRAFSMHTFLHVTFVEPWRPPPFQWNPLFPVGQRYHSAGPGIPPHWGRSLRCHE